MGREKTGKEKGMIWGCKGGEKKLVVLQGVCTVPMNRPMHNVEEDRRHACFK
jgi:hypothetical protein